MKGIESLYIKEQQRALIVPEPFPDDFADNGRFANDMGWV